jgi:hypothetical protein
MIAQQGMQVQTPTSQDLNWGEGGADDKAGDGFSMFSKRYASDGDLASVFHGHSKVSKFPTKYGSF